MYSDSEAHLHKTKKKKNNFYTVFMYVLEQIV